MGLGLGRKKGNSRRRLGLRSGAIRPIDTGVRPIDRNGKRTVKGNVRPIDRPISGTSGIKGMVGKTVKPIDRKTKGADDIFSSGFDF